VFYFFILPQAAFNSSVVLRMVALLLWLSMGLPKQGIFRLSVVPGISLWFSSKVFHCWHERPRGCFGELGYIWHSGIKSGREKENNFS
jgi:hypothetical protein